jgi:hypothetical protein
MASERAPISKKLRFEIFKRDKFTCQYCGQKAPDVVLHVDHVNPVFEGGTNDILNLLTACAGCNAGKGKRKLEDQAVLEKQRAQLEELSERRDQLEMLLAWREGLAGLREQGVDAIANAFVKHTGFDLNDFGRREADKWLEEYGLQEVLEAADTAFRQYGQIAESEHGQSRLTNDSISTVFAKIPGILRIRRAGVEKPYLRTLLYIRGILRNRLNNVNEMQCMTLLEQAHLAGMDLEDMKAAAKAARSWAGFRNELEALIEYMESGDA